MVFGVRNIIIFHFQFHRKSFVSVTYLSHWIEQHIPRLIVGIHRYILHMLSTAYREAEQVTSAVSTQQILPLLVLLLPSSPFFASSSFSVVPQHVYGTLTSRCSASLQFHIWRKSTASFQTASYLIVGFPKGRLPLKHRTATFLGV